MSNVVSLRTLKYEKMYKTYFQDINNYNRSLMMVGTAPKSVTDFKKFKIS